MRVYGGCKVLLVPTVFYLFRTARTILRRYISPIIVAGRSVDERRQEKNDVLLFIVVV